MRAAGATAGPTEIGGASIFAPQAGAARAVAAAPAINNRFAGFGIAIV